jgi:chitinase
MSKKTCPAAKPHRHLLSNNTIKTIRFVFYFLIIYSINFINPTNVSSANYKIVGYYMSWTRTTYSHLKVDYKNVTHLVHAFIWPNADGSLEIPKTILHPELIQKAHQSGVKVLISLGGWGQCAGFAPMAANATTRSQFITNIVNFCRTQHYDGIDLDWEFPETTVERANLTRLVQELRPAMDAVDPAWLLTMAISTGSGSTKHYDLLALNAYLDWLGCMTYNFHGAWSTHAGHNAPLFAPASETDGSVDQSIRFLINLGIPAEKILLGIPFYGKEFNATDLYKPSTGGDEINFNKIFPRIGNGWSYFWDNVSQVPYLRNTNHTKLVTFDDTLSVKLKAAYAANKKLDGVMIWALGSDEISNKQPLLSAIGRYFKSVSDCQELPNSNEMALKQHCLKPNYPNPFNATTNIEYFIASPGVVRLEVLNLLGQQVDLLVNEKQNRGWFHITYDAGRLNSGIYHYRLSTMDFSQSGRMLVLK